MGNVYSIRIDNIPHEGLHLETVWDRALIDETLSEIGQTGLSGTSLSLDLTISRVGMKVILEGSVNVLVELTCVRCLSVFSRPLEPQFRYIFWPKSQKNLPEEVELRQEDLEIAYFQGEHIDLRPMVREQTYLNMPNHPHCSETCRGLCPECGVNLNTESCSCSEKNDKKNTPFGVLKRLQKTSNDKET
jgi:uncharacterized protein